MAEPIFGNLQSIATSGMDTMSTIALISLYVVAIMIPIGVLWFYLLHKHRVQIKYLTDNGAMIIDDKAREVKIDGVKYWKLFRRKDMLSCPPPDVMQLTKKGKLFVSCYYTDEIGYVWAKDNVTKDTFKAEIEETEIRNGEKVKVIKKVYQPFTTQERALLAAQIRKAAERRGESVWAKIEKFLPFIMVFLMFVLVLIFWEDIAKPAIQISTINAETTKQNAIISEQNARIIMMLGYENVTINQQNIRSQPPDVS